MGSKAGMRKVGRALVLAVLPRWKAPMSMAREGGIVHATVAAGGRGPGEGLSKRSFLLHQPQWLVRPGGLVELISRLYKHLVRQEALARPVASVWSLVVCGRSDGLVSLGQAPTLSFAAARGPGQVGVCLAGMQQCSFVQTDQADKVDSEGLLRLTSLSSMELDPRLRIP